MTPSFESSAILIRSSDLFTSYGTSENTISFFSISALALRSIFPLPVLYASMIPFLPSIIPPVGKSGPLTILIKSSTGASLFFIIWIKPSIISFRLCGGILVAIPTAIPDVPFRRMFGILDGR